jgi:hypothetical protein
MPMNEAWCEVIGPEVRLTQGDLIADCPLLAWDAAALPVAGEETDALRGAARSLRADAVVMTQACDLEHDKVRNVVLCPHLPLSQFHAVWEKALQQGGQNPTARAWRNTCCDIADGFVWNLPFLNRFRGNDSFPEQEIRVVDFHDLFTIPRSFLERLARRRVRARLRLLPPYREHLSQAFARYFMRVGLPAPLERTW